MIELRGVTKAFDRFQALHDITTTIPAGVTGLLGPNGAGKSTLIKILLGLLKASAGEAQVLGFDVWRQSKTIRQLVGYMPEDDCYLPTLSGVESVQFAARLNSMPAIEALRRAHEILDFCGAGQERYRTVETYSTGMRQKLKFAQALVHDPPLLILDEPTSGLDPDEREA
ncbi:MAG: ABC transporter ATP-binding protein, partial [Planctomycetaceae bacterium]